MKILRINSLEGPGVGGTEEYLHGVNEELVRRGHAVRNLVLFARPLESSDLGGETEFRQVPAFGRSRAVHDLTGAADDAAWLRERLGAFQPDLVHLHHFTASFPAIAKALRDWGGPVVFTAHDATLVCPISTLVLPDHRICEGGVRWRCGFTGCEVGARLPIDLVQRQYFDRELKPKVRLFICPSRAIQNYLDAHGYRPTEWIPPMVEHTYGPLARRDRGPEFRIGYLGRLEAHKGLPELLAAWRQLRAVDSRIELSVAGSGPFPIPAEPGLTFRGVVRGLEKERWFGSIDVLAVPSQTFENFGLVAVEALSRGVPVVVTRVGGLPETVDGGRFGYIAEPGSVASLREAIETVRGNPAEARDRATAGRAFVRVQFSAPEHIDRLLRVYVRLVGTPSDATPPTSAA